MRLTKREIQEAISSIYGKLIEGKTDKEVMDEMGLPAEDYEKLKAAMFDDKADEIRTKPTEHLYVEYMISQAQNVHDLTEMIKDFKTSKQYGSMVGAVRARAEIYDRVIAKGQEFGMIRKEPNRTEFVGGLLVADMTNAELRKTIVTELGSMNRLMKMFGDKDLLELPNDQSIYRGPALPPSTGAKTDKGPKRVKAKMSKVHKGRKRMMPPGPTNK